MTSPSSGSGVKKLETVWYKSGSSSGSPHVSGNTVYFRSAGHQVMAFEKSTGQLRWTSQLPISDQIYSGRNIRLVGQTLVVGDIQLFGLDSANGSIKWKAQPSQGFNPGLFAFTSDGVNVFTGSSSGHLYAFDGSTGQQKWVATLVSNMATSIYTVDLVDQTVYAGFTAFYTGSAPVRPDSGGVAAVDAVTGQVRWLTYLPRVTPNLPTKIVRSVVSGPYVITSSREGYVYALNRSDGTVAWTAPPLVPNDYDARPVAVYGNTVYLGSALGIVTAYNASNGQRLWQTNLNHGSIDYHISADEKFVYALDGAGELNVLSSSDGKLQIRQEPTSSTDFFTYEPITDNNIIYIGGNTGFFAYKRP